MRCAVSLRGCKLMCPPLSVQVALEETKLSAEELTKILDPVTMVEPTPRAKL
jgi:hypothetical protein